MRVAIFSVFVVLALLVAVPAVPELAGSASAVYAQDSVPDVNVDINTGGGGAWYTNPVWIGVGVVALIAIIAIIAMAGRGGGTTVVKG